MTMPAHNADPAPETGAAEKTDKPLDKRRALGRGLDSLLPTAVPFRSPAASPDGRDARPSAGPEGGVIAELHAQAVRPAPGESVVQIRLDQIDSNPYQTRTEFDQEMLGQLAESIQANGVVQPIVVRPSEVRPGEPGRYILVLGERRCRASKLAGKETIPAIVRRVSDQQAAEMTVVENLQRQDLNCMEQAAAFSKLSTKFGLTQSQIGVRVGLSRESVANYMRLLKLPGTVMEYLMHGVLTFTDARELLKLEDNQIIAKVAKDAVENGYSSWKLSEEIENITAKLMLAPQAQRQPGKARWLDPNVRAAQRELESLLGVRVKIRDRNGKGKIVIEYATLEDYDRVLNMLTGKSA